MATSYTDGNIIADSFLTTIATQSYVVNNLSLNVPQVAAERDDENGALAAKESKQDLGRISGTCELQIPSSAHNQKLQFETFTIADTVIPSEYSGIYVIEEESISVVVNESRVRTVSIRRAIAANAA